MIKLAMVKVLILAASIAAGGIVTAEDSGGAAPEGFNPVGVYRLTHRVKVRDGRALSVAINAVDYRIYTDGITVRCYGEDNEAYTSFEIYRRDGIMMSRKDGLVENVAGVQAKTFMGGVLRQIVLSEERMVLSRFPGLSDIVEITYAERITEGGNQ